ncbi:axonemal p66.0, partial [Trypanosoma cruzi]
RAIRHGENGNDDDSEPENNDLSRQVAEFERYIGRLAEMAGSESLPDIERYICEGGEERFQLYSLLHRTQDDLAALEQEKEALQEARWIATEGSEVEHRAREELEELQAKLRQIQIDTLDHEQQAECVRTQIDASLPDVQSIFDALGCDDSMIIAQHGVSVLSRGTVKLFLASIEQRLEEYMAAWMQRQQPSHVLSPNVGYNASGFGITAQMETSKTMPAASPHV